jgi:hypothetical protein
MREKNEQTCIEPRLARRLQGSPASTSREVQVGMPQSESTAQLKRWGKDIHLNDQGQRRDPAADDVRFESSAKRLAPARWPGWLADSESTLV